VNCAKELDLGWYCDLAQAKFELVRQVWQVDQLIHFQNVNINIGHLAMQ
jgi:hypothetical protein